MHFYFYTLPKYLFGFDIILPIKISIFVLEPDNY